MAVTALLLVAGFELGWFGSTAPSRGDGDPSARFQLHDVTSLMGETFADGAPQAFGWNGTAALVTGVVGSPGPDTVPFPLLAQLGDSTGKVPPINRSGEVATLFAGGDTLGLAWNGSAWLITGEAAWGDLASGAAAAYGEGVWTNLTPAVGPFFSGAGGVWFDAWNGSAWLLGGQSGTDAALVAIQGSQVTDLTALLPNNGPDRWIQFIAWNGTDWLIGGRGVFGLLHGNRYTDLLPGSDFTHGGMFAADWNGSTWLVGGGTPGRIEFLRGGQLTRGPVLSDALTWWVSAIVWDHAGWYLGGEGSGPNWTYTSVLEYLDATTGAMVDLTPRLPSAFLGGQIQFAALAAPFGPTAVLMVGQGGLSQDSKAYGPSHGAAATVARG
jgi:hypothetical protein